MRAPPGERSSRKQPEQSATAPHPDSTGLPMARGADECPVYVDSGRLPRPAALRRLTPDPDLPRSSQCRGGPPGLISRPGTGRSCHVALIQLIGDGNFNRSRCGACRLLYAAGFKRPIDALTPDTEGARDGASTRRLTASWRKGASGANRRLTLTQSLSSSASLANFIGTIRALAAMPVLIEPTRAAGVRIDLDRGKESRSLCRQARNELALVSDNQARV